MSPTGYTTDGEMKLHCRDCGVPFDRHDHDENGMAICPRDQQ